ncbi:hypothetical protein Gotri_019462, partial [Gossypium trilobum]|nr:hypothetical protein [Gossypium trilobum]
MEQTLLSLWCSLRGANIKPIGGNGFHLIQFFHVVNLKMMISGGPWSFNNCFLSVHKLMQDYDASSQRNVLSFWPFFRLVLVTKEFLLFVIYVVFWVIVVPAAENYLILWKGCLSRVGRKRCVRRFDIETKGSQSNGIATGELG